MQLLPIHTPKLQEGDDLVSIIAQTEMLQDGDFLAISSKAVATVEGAEIDLSTVNVSDEAKEWAKRLNRNSPVEFRQAILNEVERLNGKIVSDCEHAMLAELQPSGLNEGSILAANAGMDLSNVRKGYAVGWPLDPLKSVREIRSQLQQHTCQKVGVLLTDSCCRPRRIGVTAIALTVSGFDPLPSQIGKKDLFDHTLRMTHEALADQLATAANMIMGNADQSIPAVIIRDHGIPFTEYEGWVDGIHPEEDLFKGVL